jgi:polyhydroxyalkanoate synthesis regulator phasin
MSENKDPRKIDLNEVLISLSEQSRSEMTMKIGDHKFLVGIMNAHTEVIAQVTDDRLKMFASDTWEQLIDFIKNQYEGIGNQLAIQTELIRETKGKIHDVERSLGILKQQMKKIADKTEENCTKIREFDKRIGDLEREVSAIKKEIGLQP